MSDGILSACDEVSLFESRDALSSVIIFNKTPMAPEAASLLWQLNLHAPHTSVVAYEERKKGIPTRDELQTGTPTPCTLHKGSASSVLLPPTGALFSVTSLWPADA